MVTRQRILRRFHERGIEYQCMVEPRWGDSIEQEGTLEYCSIYGGPAKAIAKVAFLAYSTPRLPNDELAGPLRAAGLAVHLVGDCKVARGVLEATSEGHAIGTTI